MKRLMLLGVALLAISAVRPAAAEDDKAGSSSHNEDGGVQSDHGNDGEKDGGEGDASQVGVGRGASTIGTGVVWIFTPIAVTQTQGLDFGAITSGSAGLVNIDPDSGARTVSGGVGAIAAKVGGQGLFVVSGEPNAAINVAVDSQIRGFSGGISGTTRFSSLPSVLKDNTASFKVGGVLKIPAQTKAGTYSGVYTVAVNYP